jgi:hypothetical protein
VLEVDPSGLAADVLLPVLGEPQHRRPARVVERGDAELVDLGLVRDAELLLRLDLGGQAVAVPAEAPLDPASAHRLVAGDDVLDVAGEQMAVVGQARWRRAGRRRRRTRCCRWCRRSAARRSPGTCRRRPSTSGPGPRSPGTGGSTGRRRCGPWGSSPRSSPRARLFVPREDDVTRRPAGRHRGTTSLATRGDGRSLTAVTGRSRPVLLGALPRSALFFRRLAGDGRVDACAGNATARNTPIAAEIPLARPADHALGARVVRRYSHSAGFSAAELRSHGATPHWASTGRARGRRSAGRRGEVPQAQAVGHDEDAAERHRPPPRSSASADRTPATGIAATLYAKAQKRLTFDRRERPA